LSDDDFTQLSKKEENIIKTGKKDKFDKKDIVFEDNDLLVINKNSGINVHP
jgi:23S rRNA-/tRNA-specific pseudouridylate synthase